MLADTTERGVYATVKLTFEVADGIIQISSVRGDAERHYRPDRTRKDT